MDSIVFAAPREQLQVPFYRPVLETSRGDDISNNVTQVALNTARRQASQMYNMRKKMQTVVLLHITVVNGVFLDWIHVMAFNLMLLKGNSGRSLSYLEKHFD